MISSPLYAILDMDVLKSRGVRLRKVAVGLRAAGVSLIQYRNKTGTTQEVLAGAATLREVFAGVVCRLILNDHAELVSAAHFHGVHLGQTDLPVREARPLIGTASLIGLSTHTDDQVRAADLTSADYIAIGPVFPTATKLNAEPAVGLEGVRRARTLTTKPLVAIGGITRENARSVLQAGANSVAVISALFAPGESVEKVARDFLDILR
ncbi:MAG: thiamine phosphate synthase [Acidobacteriota bacterium]|nr:thiamine phosphate synthase [Acidobacteriota bacterium]